MKLPIGEPLLEKQALPEELHHHHVLRARVIEDRGLDGGVAKAGALHPPRIFLILATAGIKVG